MSEVKILSKGGTHLLSVKPAVRLMLDCEFNGRNGVLLSAALAGPNGETWYEVLEQPELEEYVEWVQENVVPKFGKQPLPAKEFYDSLQNFLDQFGYVEFYYNAHADGRYLDEMLYNLADVPLNRRIRDGHLSAKASKVPHNALADAEALLDQVCGSTELIHGLISERMILNVLSNNGYPFNRTQVAIRVEAVPMKIQRSRGEVTMAKVSIFPRREQGYGATTFLVECQPQVEAV